MANRFTQKAKNALNHALECAKELGHTYIGSEHLLLGLTSEPDSVSQKFLSFRGADYKTLYQAISSWTGIGVPTSLLSPQDMTPKMKNIIESSAAQSLKNGQSYIGTEHLLWSLLEEKDCIALRILIEVDVPVEELKRDIDGFIDTIPVKNDSFKKSKSLINSGESNATSISLYSTNLVKKAIEGN